MIYFDNAATTRTREEVVEAMLPYFTEYYGNPSTVYSLGSMSKACVNDARKSIAATIGTQPQNIYFTSGGTEADNWAIKMVAQTCRNKGNHIITTRVEHHAVLKTCEWLEKNGYEVSYLKVDKFGRISISELEKLIRPTTILISVMFANNEVGTIQPIAEIGRIARAHDIVFHTDAVQAYGHYSIDVEEMNIDLMSVSAHKIYGPKGIGFLYARQGLPMASFIHGGAQERKLRAGTENVPGIAGLGEAAKLICEEMYEDNGRIEAIRAHMIERLKTEITGVTVNGHKEHHLPGILNLSFEYIEGEALLILLNLMGVCASSGSACTIGADEPSHVLLAMGLDARTANSSLRLSIGKYNTMEEADACVDVIKQSVGRLRRAYNAE